MVVFMEKTLCLKKTVLLRVCAFIAHMVLLKVMKYPRNLLDVH